MNIIINNKTDNILMLDFSPGIVQKALTISGQRARGSPENINVIFI